MTNKDRERFIEAHDRRPNFAMVEGKYILREEYKEFVAELKSLGSSEDENIGKALDRLSPDRQHHWFKTFNVYMDPGD